MNTAAVESHSPCAREVVLPWSDFLDGLLRHDIAGCEEHLQPDISTLKARKKNIGLLTAVVRAWVSTGRCASFIWYLDELAVSPCQGR